MEKRYKDFYYDVGDVIFLMNGLIANGEQIFCNETIKAVENYERLVSALLENFVKFQYVIAYRLSGRKKYTEDGEPRFWSYASMIPLEETFKLSDEEFKEYVVDYSNFFICVLKQLGIMNYSEKKKEFKNPETLKAKEMLISKRIRNEFGCQNRVKTIYNRLERKAN